MEQYLLYCNLKRSGYTLQRYDLMLKINITYCDMIAGFNFQLHCLEMERPLTFIVRPAALGF